MCFEGAKTLKTKDIDGTSRKEETQTIEDDKEEGESSIGEEGEADGSEDDGDSGSGDSGDTSEAEYGTDDE